MDVEATLSLPMPDSNQSRCGENMAFYSTQETNQIQNCKSQNTVERLMGPCNLTFVENHSASLKRHQRKTARGYCSSFSKTCNKLIAALRCATNLVPISQLQLAWYRFRLYNHRSVMNWYALLLVIVLQHRLLKSNAFNEWENERGQVIIMLLSKKCRIQQRHWRRYSVVSYNDCHWEKSIFQEKESVYCYKV